MTIKLYYFALPGRGEVSRLLLTGGNVEFEDVRVDFGGPQWAELKPTTPFGQMPVLDVDGTVIAQSKAIDVYCAKISGLYPEDPLVAAQADMVIGQLEDIYMLFAATFRLTDSEEKIKARQELLAGAAKEKILKLEELLAGKEFVAGDKLSYADVTLFCVTSMLVCGFIEGIPPTVWDDYPVIKALRNKVAKTDFVAKYYENETEGLRMAFKPSA